MAPRMFVGYAVGFTTRSVLPLAQTWLDSSDSAAYIRGSPMPAFACKRDCYGEVPKHPPATHRTLVTERLHHTLQMAKHARLHAHRLASASRHERKTAARQSKHRTTSPHGLCARPPYFQLARFASLPWLIPVGAPCLKWQACATIHSALSSRMPTAAPYLALAVGVQVAGEDSV